MIPFASVLSEGGQQALRTLALPRLDQLLARLTAAERDGGDEYSLSPPHERALAQVIGLAGADGALPWAAHAAARDGVDTGERAWGLLTPAHWQLAADHVNLLDPMALALDESESRALFEAVRELFESEGFVLAYGAPLRWYVAHESLADLPCASLDRVIGRDVDLWLTDDPRARLVRRLQNEVQMLLHTHPINEQREARGALPVNSFWLSGCGARQPGANPPGLQRGRTAARTGARRRLGAWAERGRRSTPARCSDALGRLHAGEPLMLTLCGERTRNASSRGAQRCGQRLARGRCAGVAAAPRSRCLERAL